MFLSWLYALNYSRLKYHIQVIRQHVSQFKCRAWGFTFLRRDVLKLWNCWTYFMGRLKPVVSLLLITPKLNLLLGVLQILLLIVESLFGGYLHGSLYFVLVCGWLHSMCSFWLGIFQMNFILQGIGNSVATWQPCLLLLSGSYLYLFESAKSQ